MERIFSLNGDDWQFGEVKSAHIMANILDEAALVNFLPAKVPGGIALDLQRNNIIPDPFYGKNAQQCQWIKDSVFWYKKNFTGQCSGGSVQGEKERQQWRIFLKFKGVDYESNVFLNGAHLGRHIGMFSQQLYEITPHIKEQNELLVRLDKLSRYKRREHTLRAQFTYGWDFAPCILNPAIWDDVEVVTCHKALIESVHIKTGNRGPGTGNSQKNGELHFALSFNSSENVKARLKIKISAVNFTETPQEFERSVEIQKGAHSHHIILNMENPKEWNPWDRGFPHLYQAEASLCEGSETLDIVQEIFGFCDVSLEKHPQDKTEGPGWIFVINGKREFLRGTNWVPCDVFYGRITDETYRKHIQMAKEAGVNCIRLWGGGLKEKQAFYDICDEEGMLVWQEFPFACIMTTSAPKDEAFLRLTEQESRAIVRDLRNHPSTIMYCGGNEFSFKRNQHIIKLLERVVHEEDGTRPFNPVSPVYGESHNYTVWHAFAPVTNYENDHSPFPSEFGVQSAPSVETLKKFIPEDKLFPIKPNMHYKLFDFGLSYPHLLEKRIGNIPKSSAIENATYWGYHHAQLLKQFYYLRIFGRKLNRLTLDEFVELSQKFQCAALQHAIEHYRRGKYYTGGIMFWQWDEPWPAVCWSVVDYYGNPKPAYEMLKKSVYAPILISLKFPRKKYRHAEHFTIHPYVVNDTLNAYTHCHLVFALQHKDNNEREITRFSVNVKEDSITALTPIKMSFQNAWDTLSAKLFSGGKLLAENRYDISLPLNTPNQPQSIKALYAVATKLVME